MSEEPPLGFRDPEPEQEVDIVRRAGKLVKKMLRRTKRNTELSIDELSEMPYGDYESPTGYHQRAKKLIERLGVSPGVIYYPGSNLDVGFTKLFPASRVIHVDLDQDVVDEMAAAGYEAKVADMKSFIPDEPADVVVVFNAGYIEQDQLKRVLKPNGLVIVNNYHRAATFMRDSCPDFSLQGVVMQNSSDIVDPSDFDVAELGQLPKDGEIIWPAHSETIFAFRWTNY